MLVKPISAAFATAAFALCVSGFAAITPAGACSFNDVSGAGVTVTDCSGHYTRNSNAGADFSEVKG